MRCLPRPALASRRCDITDAHSRIRDLILVAHQHIRIINAAPGELLREFVLDPTKRYQGTGRPPGPTR